MPKYLTIDDIYDPERKRKFTPAVVPEPVWLDEERWIEPRDLQVPGDPESRSLVLNQARTQAIVEADDALHLYDFASAACLRLTGGTTPAFSRNGKLVSFVRDNNLFVIDLESRGERALTTDGGPQLLNGRLDGVYQEELYGRGNFAGHWWSPDSGRIAYLQFDESPVKDGYPFPGESNPVVRLGVVDVETASTTWVESNAELIVRAGWSRSGDVVYQLQDREQRWLELRVGARVVLREESPAWVRVLGEPVWLSDGSFLWLSERAGSTQLYRYNADGKLRRRLTDDSLEVRVLHGVDEEKGVAYFSSATDAYEVGLDGAEPRRLSSGKGTHRYTFSPKFTRHVDQWADVKTPPGGLGELAEYEFGDVEFVPTPHPAMMIRPPNFDPARRYPVLCHMYGGPHHKLVVDAWGGEKYLWHQMMAQRGFIIFVCDVDTPEYRNLGESELLDLEESVAWLKAQSYVESSRIGLWGWSYGGFMTAYALTHSTTFKMGIIGAPVTDWRLYDSIYTERYMAAPQNNPSGYDKSSVVTAASNLHGKALIIHGLDDDNVLVRNTHEFVNALQNAGKQFELMLYPGASHAITDPLQLKHLRTLMMSFVVENL